MASRATRLNPGPLADRTLPIPNIPMPLLATTLPLAAIMMTVAATLVRDGRGYVEPPTWSGTATVVLLIYALLIVPYLLLLRKQAASHMGDRLRAKGMEPRAFVGLSGRSEERRVGKERRCGGRWCR